jgi:prepilin-type N-terminal cleavage/methylation domain-containing protein
MGVSFCIRGRHSFSSFVIDVFMRKPVKFKNGFSLIELVVAMGIIAILSGIIFARFRAGGENKQAQLRAAAVFEADIRRMQSMALAGANHETFRACGFGLQYEDGNHYRLYAGSPNFGNCDSANPAYEPGIDSTIALASLRDGMFFLQTFPYIFFEAPDPTTYIGGDPNGQAIVHLTQDLEGGCSGICTYIVVDGSGKIAVDGITN